VYHSYNILKSFLILENCKDLVCKGFDKFRSHFGGNVKLLAGETDSLRVQIYDPDSNFLVPDNRIVWSVSLGCLTVRWTVG
jgi:hypothetical protein